MQSLWVTIIAYGVAISFVRISITFQYLRIFGGSGARNPLRAYLAIIAIFSIWVVLSTVFGCWPIEANWNLKDRANSVCLNSQAVAYANASIGIVVDLILLAVPIALLRNLHIPKRQKYIVLGVFGIGALSCVMSMIRLAALYQIGRVDHPSAIGKLNQSLALHCSVCIILLTQTLAQPVNIAIWSCIEVTVAIFCGSVPALKPLLVKYFPRVLSSTFNSGTAGTPPSFCVGSGGGGSGVERQTRSTRVQVAKGGAAITIEQTFEMQVAAVGADGQVSRDGSQMELVV